MDTSSLDVLRSIAPLPDIIVSGGQTGADLGGLYGAASLGIATGGYCPRGFKTESGPMPDLGKRFGLVESQSTDYAFRTRQNVVICDAIILAAYNFNSAGTKLTKRLALEHSKPIFEVPYSPHLQKLNQIYCLIDDMRLWLSIVQPGVLNVAGNRESIARGIQGWTADLIQRIFVDT